MVSGISTLLNAAIFSKSFQPMIGREASEWNENQYWANHQALSL
jgi:hypothetical protein